MHFFFSLVSPMKQVDVFLWTSSLLHNHPAYMQAGFHKPESLQNWLNVWNSASAGKFMGNHWYFWFTAWHESHCLSAHFGTPSSLHLLKADLAFSLSQISTDLFSLSNCEACCFTSYTLPEIKAGESWCDVLIQYMQLISSYFLNQKIAGFFLLYKGRSITEGLTTRQPAREAKTDKKRKCIVWFFFKSAIERELGESLARRDEDREVALSSVEQ